MFIRYVFIFNRPVTTGGITSEIGATWTCQTANYDPSFTSTYTKGIGKYVSSVVTHDDVLWMMGGQVPNTTTGLNVPAISKRTDK